MSNAAEMDAQEIINYIATAPKKTPVKLYVREKPGMKVAWGDAHVYGGRRGKTVFGDWDELKAILDANADSIDYYDVENDCRNSAVPMLDLKGINARIEPGAIIRDRVEIGDRAVIMMGAIINIGAVIGELLHIEDGVTRAGDWLQKKFGKMGPITDGFVSGSLVFAVGAMAVMGSLDSGLKNDHGILLAKSVIDFAGSVAFASSMGIGIVFSGLSVLAVEGVMTLLASLLTGVLTDAVITEISVTGSLMIIGITLNVLGVTKLRILNMTPALLLPVLLCKFM